MVVFFPSNFFCTADRARRLNNTQFSTYIVVLTLLCYFVSIIYIMLNRSLKITASFKIIQKIRARRPLAFAHILHRAKMYICIYVYIWLSRNHIILLWVQFSIIYKARVIIVNWPPRERDYDNVIILYNKRMCVPPQVHLYNTDEYNNI